MILAERGHKCAECMGAMAIMCLRTDRTLYRQNLQNPLVLCVEGLEVDWV